MSKQIDRAWKSLVLVSNARDTAKSREKDLVQERKDLDNRLDELGAGDTAEHQRVSRRFVVCIRAIEYERERLKTLDDTLDHIIRDAIQGKFDFAESIDEEGLVSRPSESELFSPEPVEAAKPVGRAGPVKPEEPDPSKGDGVDEHLNASVKELDMPERLIGLCENAGITKIAHVVKVLDDSDGDAPSLGEKVNGSDKDAKAIAKAVKTFRTAHRKAAMKAEGIES